MTMSTHRSRWTGGVVCLAAVLTATVAAAAVDVSAQYMGAVFEQADFAAYQKTFARAIQRVNADTHTSLKEVALPAFDDVHVALMYVCDALDNRTFNSFLVVGGQDTINTLTIVTQYVGIPLLAYNTDVHAVTLPVSRPPTPLSPHSPNQILPHTTHSCTR